MNAKATTIIGLATAILVLTACGGGGGDDAEPDVPVTTSNYNVEFTPNQVIGAPAAPASITAAAVLRVARGEETLASGTVTVTGANATSVAIREGFAGENGAVAVTLSNDSGTWRVPAPTELNFDEFFRLEAGGYYVAIETPEGSMRGQILQPDLALAIVDLDAASVLPPSQATSGAKAGFTVNALTFAYRARITTFGVDQPLSAAVHRGIAGTVGDVAVALEPSMDQPGVWGSRDISNVLVSGTLLQEDFLRFLDGALYFGLASEANPEGAIRGQILAPEVEVFDAVLSTAGVVSSGAPVDSNAGGIATITWIPSTSRLGVALNTDIVDAVRVSVHQGPPGQIGPVLYELMPSGSLSGNWVLPVTELSSQQADAAASGSLYISVVTAAFPDGELRGQLVKGE